MENRLSALIKMNGMTPVVENELPLNRGQYVQFDHNQDDDDFLYDKELRAVEQMNDEQNVQFSHDGDTEDLDLNMPAPATRGSARQRMAEDDQWNNFFQKSGEASS